MKKKKIRGIQSLPKDAVYDMIDFPIDKLIIIASSKNLHAILWDKKVDIGLDRAKDHPIILQTQQQLNEYFQCKRKQFDLPITFQGTDFQMSVWKELMNIPYGETISYGEQARRVGNKNKARATGVANGSNPISIVIPCHRVIGSNGSLVGFGGGLDKKSYLLALEQRLDFENSSNTLLPWQR